MAPIKALLGEGTPLGAILVLWAPASPGPPPGWAGGSEFPPCTEVVLEAVLPDGEPDGVGSREAT